MTREEAIEELKEDIALYMPTEWVEELDRDTPDGRLITALEMAIKALESKDVLDKIRAEIYRKAHSGQWSDATMYGMLKAVAIIDKYKAESEEV